MNTDSPEFSDPVTVLPGIGEKGAKTIKDDHGVKTIQDAIDTQINLKTYVSTLGDEFTTAVCSMDTPSSESSTAINQMLLYYCATGGITKDETGTRKDLEYILETGKGRIENAAKTVLVTPDFQRCGIGGLTLDGSPQTLIITESEKGSVNYTYTTASKRDINVDDNTFQTEDVVWSTIREERLSDISNLFNVEYEKPYSFEHITLTDSPEEPIIFSAAEDDGADAAIAPILVPEGDDDQFISESFTITDVRDL